VHSYRICGLSVASDIGLPGLIAGAPETEPQVTIRRGPVPKTLPAPTAAGPVWQIAGKHFLYHIPNIAWFLVRDGNEIVFAPESDASIEAVPIFLIGTVFGILLHQREQIVLHASAVEVNGRVIVFCGPSGAGKSTLAAALGQLGYRLITDDVCAISFANERRPIVHPGGRQLRLWAKAIEELELEGNCRERVRSRLDKFHVEPQEATTAALPLGAVYVLRESAPNETVGIQRLNVVDSAWLFEEQAYRLMLVQLMEQKEHYFHAAAKIVNECGVFHLKLTFDFAVLPKVISGLEEHWCEIGLMEQSALARAPEKEDTMMIQRRGDWLSAKAADELAMMSAETGSYLGLTEVGARIWELIEIPQEIDALCSKLQEEFDVTTETCRTDVDAFLNEMVKHGAITLDPPPAG
jgi:energy-coupling factor transporter ATP-binding protein EcfA2